MKYALIVLFVGVLAFRADAQFSFIHKNENKFYVTDLYGFYVAPLWRFKSIDKLGHPNEAGDWYSYYTFADKRDSGTVVGYFAGYYLTNIPYQFDDLEKAKIAADMPIDKRTFLVIPDPYFPTHYKAYNP